MTTTLRTIPSTATELFVKLGYNETPRKVAHNTTARWEYLGAQEGCWTIALHGKDIVQVRHDGGVRVRHCGYVTTTTFDRINRFLPAGYRAHRRGGVGLIHERHERPVFAHDLTIAGKDWTPWLYD